MLDDRTHDEAAFGTCRVEEGVCVVVPERLPSGSMVSHILDLLEGSDAPPADVRCTVRAVVDLRHARFEPTTSEIRCGVTRLGRIATGGRIALVVASDFQFGLGRMFGALCEGSGFDVRPFRAADDATGWIGQPD